MSVNPFNTGPGELSTDFPDPSDYCGEDEVCGECGGDGYIERDCDEDSCCCADPELEHGIVRCPACKGRG